MVVRFTTLFPIILILLILAGAEISGLAGEHFLFAAESGHNGTAGTEARQIAAAAGNIADHSVITERNLFGLPLEKTEKEAVSDPFAGLQPTSLDLVLMGIVDGGSRDSRAIILSKKYKKQQLYQVGDMVAGAQIKSILWGKVVLSMSGRDELLDMKEAAQYRTFDVAVKDPVAAPMPSQGKLVPSSDGGEEASRFIPERVRLVLPDRKQGGQQSEELTE